MEKSTGFCFFPEPECLLTRLPTFLYTHPIFINLAEDGEEFDQLLLESSFVNYHMKSNVFSSLPK